MIGGFVERASDMTRYLQEYAGVDPSLDRKYTGYIGAINDLLNITVEETQGT